MYGPWDLFMPGFFNVHGGVVREEKDIRDEVRVISSCCDFIVRGCV